MAIIHAKDKRSGITYVYESKSFWDKERKQSRAKRTLIGRLDENTGEIIPTDGRCKKLSPSYVPPDGTAEGYQMPTTIKTLKAEVRRLLAENAELKKQLAELKAQS